MRLHDRKSSRKKKKWKREKEKNGHEHQYIIYIKYTTYRNEKIFSSYVQMTFSSFLFLKPLYKIYYSMRCVHFESHPYHLYAYMHCIYCDKLSKTKTIFDLGMGIPYILHTIYRVLYCFFFGKGAGGKLLQRWKTMKRSKNDDRWKPVQKYVQSMIVNHWHWPHCNFVPTIKKICYNDTMLLIDET